MSASYPKRPYKGLSFYGPQDAGIFAGREDDVRRCSELLGATTTRALVVHGRTACGKSSFLRAGLIPFLEKPEHGFHFLRHGEQKVGPERESAKSLFVRSTENPLAQLATCLYTFIDQGVTVQTPIGLERLDLTEIVGSASSCSDFVQEVGKSPEQLIEALRQLAARWPGTLILVLDQAEEVLSLRRDVAGDIYRDRFFQFLSAFTNCQFDLKLLLAIRTEWYGRFLARLPEKDRQARELRDYSLEDLSEDQMVRAIKHPTTIDQYAFSYDKGVAEKIAAELNSNQIQGKLSCLQVVCDNLYRRITADRVSSARVITNRAFGELGGVEGQLSGYIDRVLTELCSNSGIPAEKQETEKRRWFNLLNSLVTSQPDGTVTTAWRFREDLQRQHDSCGCHIPLGQALQFLEHDDQRILYSTNVISIDDGLPHDCFFLGHDVVGLALRRWEIDQARSTSELEVELSERIDEQSEDFIRRIEESTIESQKRQLKSAWTFFAVAFVAAISAAFLSFYKAGQAINTARDKAIQTAHEEISHNYNRVSSNLALAVYRKVVFHDAIDSIESAMSSLSSTMPADRVRLITNTLHREDEELQQLRTELKELTVSPSYELTIDFIFKFNKSIEALIQCIVLAADRNANDDAVNKQIDVLEHSWKAILSNSTNSDHELSFRDVDRLTSYASYALGVLKIVRFRREFYSGDFLKRTADDRVQLRTRLDEALDYFVTSEKLEKHFAKTVGMQGYVHSQQRKLRVDAAMADAHREDNPALRLKAYPQGIRELETARRYYERAAKLSQHALDESISLNNSADCLMNIARYRVALQNDVEVSNTDSKAVLKLFDTAEDIIQRAELIPDGHPVVFITHAEIIALKRKLEDKEPDEAELLRQKNEIARLVKNARERGYSGFPSDRAAFVQMLELIFEAYPNDDFKDQLWELASPVIE